MLLGFRANRERAYHNGPEALVNDGDFFDYSDAEARRLLQDFPKNFFVPTAKADKDVLDEVMAQVEKAEKEIDSETEEEEKKSIKDAPDKMVHDEKPANQKKKSSKK